MSPVSPLTGGTVLNVAVMAEGREIDATIQVLSVDTWSAINKVPRARLVLVDGDPTTGAFPVSSGATFVPGASIDIRAGYDGRTTSLFSGIVIAHGIDISRNAASSLVVDLAAAAVKMTVARRSDVFEKTTDATLIRTLIANHGLKADVGTADATHEVVVQYDATDWDMMLLRAEKNGLVAAVDGETVTVKAPDTSQAPLLQVGYGDDILELRAEMDAVRQVTDSAIKSYAWDSGTQQLLSAAPAGVSVSQAGNLTSQTLAGVCGASAIPQLTGGFLTQEDLQAWSSAELQRSKLAKIRGRVTFQGSALAKPATMIQIDGVGERFNGNVFVGAVHHDLRHGRWLTTVDFGLPSDGFADTTSVAAAPASGQLPPIKGLQTGVVLKVAEDPASQFRVQVKLPLTQSDQGVWARLSSFYASNAVGAVFYPEVGDEVVVGFMNEDPRFPIVLGSVYSTKLAPPYTPETENPKKGIVTRSKLEISFDETDKILTIKTPGNHVMTLDDKSGAITITDSNSNSVTLGKSGITIDSASTMEIKAKGNISITAGGNLGLKATANATCEGLQVEMKAQTAFSAQGNASAELKASGMVTVQGALVKIN